MLLVSVSTFGFHSILLHFTIHLCKMFPVIHYVKYFLIDVHPFLVCEKLGPKYASVPVDELNKRQDFYEDLLRYFRSYYAKHIVSVLLVSFLGSINAVFVVVY